MDQPAKPVSTWKVVAAIALTLANLFGAYALYSYNQAAVGQELLEEIQSTEIELQSELEVPSGPATKNTPTSTHPNPSSGDKGELKPY